MHLKPKKYLGQNFLVDPNIRRKIIDACQFSDSDVVLEIGAGRGELTRIIAGQAARVYALEVDGLLCQALEKEFSSAGNVEVIHADILKFPLKKIIPTSGKIIVIGNIPYYITTPIIEKIFQYKNKVQCIFLTVQKEFGQRIAACPGTKAYGAFSCFVQYFSLPELLFFIKKGCFAPVPKVDSCFLKLTPKRRLPLTVKRQDCLFKIIRASFNQRRKTLRNSLEGVISRGKLEAFFARTGLDVNTRPERLFLEDFMLLAK